MSSKPFITEADVAAFLFQKKPKPESTVPTIRFDVPPLTTEQIVNSVQNDKPVWRTLQALHEESIEDRRAKALERRHPTLTPIPQPEWEEDL